MSSAPAHFIQRRQNRYALRHRVHNCAYAAVAFGLFTMGAVFSGFAIFERQSEISKIWLAGPTTIAVALVLCGKVMIDRRPRQFLNESADDETQGIVRGAHISWSQQNVKELEAVSFMDVQTYLQIAQHPNTDLVIENFYLTDPRLTMSKPIQQQTPSDKESQIWNLRTADDLLKPSATAATSSSSSPFPYFHLPRSPPPQTAPPRAQSRVRAQPELPDQCRASSHSADQSESISPSQQWQSELKEIDNAQFANHCDHNLNCNRAISIDESSRATVDSGQQGDRNKNGQSWEKRKIGKIAKEKKRKWKVPLASYSRNGKGLFADLSILERPQTKPPLYQGETFLINDKPYLI